MLESLLHPFTSSTLRCPILRAPPLLAAPSRWPTRTRLSTLQPSLAPQGIAPLLVKHVPGAGSAEVVGFDIDSTIIKTKSGKTFATCRFFTAAAFDCCGLSRKPNRSCSRGCRGRASAVLRCACNRNRNRNRTRPGGSRLTSHCLTPRPSL